MSKKLLMAGVLLCSHILMSCGINPSLDKQSLGVVEEKSTTQHPTALIVPSHDEIPFSQEEIDYQLAIQSLAQDQESKQEDEIALIPKTVQVITDTEQFSSEKPLFGGNQQLFSLHDLEAFGSPDNQSGYTTLSLPQANNNQNGDKVYYSTLAATGTGANKVPENQHNSPVGVARHARQSSKQHTLDQQRALQVGQSRNCQARQAKLQLIEKELVGKSFKTRAGQKVSFYQEVGTGILKAEVHEKLGNFTSTSKDLKVYFGDFNPDQGLQTRFIHIVTPKQAKDEKGYIYIDQGGLMGGMKASDDNKPFVDPHAEDFSDDSEDGLPEPTSPKKEDPFDGYKEALDLEKRIRAEMEEVARKKGLRLSQVKFIEKKLADLRKAGKISKEELAKIKAEAQQQINFVLNWNARPTLDIKCKGCNRQMGADEGLIYVLEESIFGGPWVRCDSYGNTIPGSPSYPSLRAFHRAYGVGNSFVNTCVYCYREKDIAREEAKIADARQQHAKLTQEYEQAARRTNRSANKEKSIQKKLAQQVKNIALYQAAISALEEVAKQMEKFRAEAIVDYEAITYGDSDKYRGRLNK